MKNGWIPAKIARANFTFNNKTGEIGKVKNRKIKSHKGGRTSRLDIRLSEAEKREIADKADLCGMNRTDLIVAAVRAFKCEEPRP